MMQYAKVGAHATFTDLQRCYRWRRLAVNLAQIYAWTGDKELAIEQIATIERTPNLVKLRLS